MTLAAIAAAEPSIGIWMIQLLQMVKEGRNK
jgi:hypothetical protein